MLYLGRENIREISNTISARDLDDALGGGILCPWRALEGDVDQMYSQVRDLRYARVNSNLGDVIHTEYSYNTGVVASTERIRNVLRDQSIIIEERFQLFDTTYAQEAISITEYRSSLDRYQEISNFFAYELYNTNEGDLMLPTPRYRSSIIVPYQLNKIANNNEVVNQTVKLIRDFLIKADEHYQQLDQNDALKNANYNYSEYNLPRPVLFQTLVNMLGPEREMVKQKNEAIDKILPRSQKQQMRKHLPHIGDFNRDNLLLIPTNHSLNRNKKKFGAFANFVTDHRAFGKSGANIQELKYVVLAFSNYLYMVLHNYQENKDQIKLRVLSLLHSRSRYSVFINDNLRYQSAEIKRCALIAAMLNVYSYLMHMTFVNRRVMLQRAAYETLIISLCGGIVHSSCKSGKDREGMIVVFTDALLIYIERYGYCPDLENNRHKRFFAEIFTQCFFSGSAMSISAMTALYLKT